MLLATLLVFLVLLPAPAVASDRIPLLQPPVPGEMARPFQLDQGPYGPGHRGISLTASPGTALRAPAPGTVAFAGQVAGTRWVTLTVAPDVVVTVGPVGRLAVRTGQRVGSAAMLGTLAGGEAHFGLRVDSAYVDPLPHVAAHGPARLVPVPGERSTSSSSGNPGSVSDRGPAGPGPGHEHEDDSEHEHGSGNERGAGPEEGTGSAPRGSGPGTSAGTSAGTGPATQASPAAPVPAPGQVATALPNRLAGLVRSQFGGFVGRLAAIPAALVAQPWWSPLRSALCGDAPSDGPLSPPSENLVMGVAGIATDSERAHELDLESLGYDAADITRFSYAGLAPPGADDLVATYTADDTYGPVRDAAGRLYDQLVALHARHPGRAVDLVAHSQGGVVVATFLAERHDPEDPLLPPIGTVVTIASPHRGADVATTLTRLQATPWGGRLLDVLEPVTAAFRAPSIPAASPAVRDLAEGSELMEQLAAAPLDRIVAIRAGFDVVVTEPQAGRPSMAGRTVCATHEGVLADPRARAVVHAALAGAPLPPGAPRGDAFPRFTGRLIDRGVDELGRGLERLMGVPDPPPCRVPAACGPAH